MWTWASRSCLWVLCMCGGDPGSEDWTLKPLSSTLKHLLSLAALTLFSPSPSSEKTTHPSLL